MPTVVNFEDIEYRPNTDLHISRGLLLLDNSVLFEVLNSSHCDSLTWNIV